MPSIKKPLNKYIDHTLLKPETTYDDIKKLCKEAEEYDFFAVCVNSCYVKYAAKLLADTDVKIASVIGFPLGASSTRSKVFETEDACLNGASEIDMVINVGLLKSDEYDECEEDIRAVVEAAKLKGATVKVILETCLLNDLEIEKACKLSVNAGAEFVKTSTGFNVAGATPHHVALMRTSVNGKSFVKASGGIRNLKAALEMIDEGADRLGLSASVPIMEEFKKL